MAIDERARLDLYQRLEEVLGPESAATMMAHLSPSGWGDVATKADLAFMASGIRADFEAQLMGLRGEIGGLRGEFGGLRVELAALRAEMYRSQRHLAIALIGVVGVMNSALVAVVAALR